MHCGCPLPGESIGQKLNRFVRTKRGPTFLLPPDDEDLLAGTHPSDHNVVYSFHRKTIGESPPVRRKRAAKFDTRRRREAELESKEKSSLTLAERSSSASHACPLLKPVPIFFADVGGGDGYFAMDGVIDGANAGCMAVSDVPLSCAKC